MNGSKSEASWREKAGLYQRLLITAMQENNMTIQVVPHPDLPPGTIITGRTPGAKAAYKNGFMAGARQVIENFETYYVPFNMAIDRVNRIAERIVGGCFGGTLPPPEMMENFAGDLARHMADLWQKHDNLIAYLESCGAEVDPDLRRFDVSGATDLLRAAQDYASGRDKTGDRLRALIASRNNTMAALIEFVANYRPGRRIDPAREYIGRKGQETREKMRIEGKNDSWRHVQENMIHELTRKQQTGLDYPEDVALITLEGQRLSNSVSYVKQAARAYRKRRAAWAEFNQMLEAD
jgi:hypothetical protein